MSTRQHNHDTNSNCTGNYTYDRFRSLIETSANVFWVTTPEGVMLEDSPSWTAFTQQESSIYKG